MRTYAVINPKGGCGKTTVATHLAAAMAATGRKTLLVDLDSQSHCALGLAVPEKKIERCVGDVLAAPDRVRLTDHTWQVSAKLDLLPATARLAETEKQIAHTHDAAVRLVRALSRTGTAYEVCVIDTPPNLGVMTANALRAADQAVVPVQMGFFSLHAVERTAAVLQQMADRARQEIAFALLPTMFDPKDKLSVQVLEQLRGKFPDSVLPLVIHLSHHLQQAAGYGQPIHECHPKCKAAQDFQQLAELMLAPRQSKPARLVPPVEMQPPHEYLATAPAPPADDHDHFEDDTSAEIPLHARHIPGSDRLTDLLKRTQALLGRKPDKPATASAQSRARRGG